MNSNLETLNLTPAQLEAFEERRKIGNVGWDPDGDRTAGGETDPTEIQKRDRVLPFPKAVVDALIRVNYAPAWALRQRIYKRWYEDFKKRNPVKLTSALLAEFEISKDQKSKGLKFWNKATCSLWSVSAVTIHWLQ
jgi:hypothetical protein